MKSYWGLANFISLGNATCGILSIFESLNHQWQRALVFILAAVIFDFLDGKTARYLHQDSIFGKGLDCLSDVISFGVAPAAVGLIVMSPLSLGSQTLLIAFVLAGVWRLAYFFQWSKQHRPPGMPITINGLIFPALLAIHPPTTVLVTAYALSTLLMVAPIFLSRPSVS